MGDESVFSRDFFFGLGFFAAGGPGFSVGGWRWTN